MAPIHKQLATGRWYPLSLVVQLASVGSDGSRAARWYGKDQQRCEQAFERALELLDLTIADDRWKGRLKELTRTRELLCDAMFGGTTYGSDLASLDRYFFTSPWLPELGGERRMRGHAHSKTDPKLISCVSVLRNGVGILFAASRPPFNGSAFDLGSALA